MRVQKAGEFRPRHEANISEEILSVNWIEPLKKMPQDNFLFKVPPNFIKVIKNYVPDFDGGQRIHHRAVAGKPVTEEKVFPDRRGQEKIVIEIDDLFRKPGNPVHHQLYGVCAEHRQIFSGNVVGVPHPVQFGRVKVEPVGFLPAGDEMHFVHPRREFLHPAEPIAQKSVVAVAFLRAVDVAPLFGRRVLVELRQPLRVTSVHPGDYKVNVAVSFHIHLEKID